jgi:hypothetical protein
MASRKPLVLVSGEIQQLQAGDTLNASVNEVDIYTATNGDAAPHAIGDVVYISAAATVKKAKADAGGTKDAIAIAAAAITNATTGPYQTDGILGGLSALTPGAVYYLSPATAGLITATAPTTAGQYVVRIGIAVSATELDIKIERPILL